MPAVCGRPDTVSTPRALGRGVGHVQQNWHDDCCGGAVHASAVQCGGQYSSTATGIVMTALYGIMLGPPVAASCKTNTWCACGKSGGTWRRRWLRDGADRSARYYKTMECQGVRPSVEAAVFAVLARRDAPRGADSGGKALSSDDGDAGKRRYYCLSCCLALLTTNKHTTTATIFLLAHATNPPTPDHSTDRNDPVDPSVWCICYGDIWAGRVRQRTSPLLFGWLHTVR